MNEKTSVVVVGIIAVTVMGITLGLSMLLESEPEDISLEKLPDDFITEYQGRDIIKELNMTHYDIILSEEIKPRMAKAMFDIRNMTESERGEINRNLIFLSFENSGMITQGQQAVLDMSMFVDRPKILCTELRDIDTCARLLTMETMYRMIDLNHTANDTSEWWSSVIDGVDKDWALQNFTKGIGKN